MTVTEPQEPGSDRPPERAGPGDGRTDVSEVTDIPEKHYSGCDPEDHLIESVPGTRSYRCGVCGYATQTLIHQKGQDADAVMGDLPWWSS